MSRHELVAAYSSGRIGRRAFISGLTGLGVTATAAAAYATALEPHTAKAQPANSICSELYPPQLSPPTLPELPPQVPQQVQDRLAEVQQRLNARFAETQQRLNARFNEIRDRFGCKPL